MEDERTTLDEGTVPVALPVIRHSEKVDKILPAMLAAQRAIAHATKDSENPHFHSSYASLNAYIDACKQAYNDNDIVVIQGVGGTDELIVVGTQLAHISGQWYECEMQGKPEKTGPQPKGSVITYFRRYTLSALGFMGAEDDDGNAGQAPPPPPKKKTGTKKQAKKEADAPEELLKAEAAFDTAWDAIMEAIGEDDADNVKALRRKFFKATTEKSNAFLAMADSTKGMTAKEVVLITAMLTKGHGTVEGLCLGEWRTELGLPSLGVEVCTVCGDVLTEAQKSGCAVSGIAPHCDKCSGDALKAKFKGGGKHD